MPFETPVNLEILCFELFPEILRNSILDTSISASRFKVGSQSFIGDFRFNQSLRFLTALLSSRTLSSVPNSLSAQTFSRISTQEPETPVNVLSPVSFAKSRVRIIKRER